MGSKLWIYNSNTSYLGRDEIEDGAHSLHQAVVTIEREKRAKQFVHGRKTQSPSSRNRGVDSWDWWIFGGCRESDKRAVFLFQKNKSQMRFGIRVEMVRYVWVWRAPPYSFLFLFLYFCFWNIIIIYMILPARYCSIYKISSVMPKKKYGFFLL